jgi:glucose-1-phosphate cytidylyltransferase
MKVVLFCGGFGTRLREHSDTVPKPLVNIGARPILWHLMRYYAHFGHKDFILCLGYRGDMIREFFLSYNECISNDFTFSEGGKRIDLHTSDIADWRITFVDTGLHSNIGQRLMRARSHLQGEEMFLANYSDGLSDLALDRYLEKFRNSNMVAQFLSVPIPQSFHAVDAGPDGVVRSLTPVRQLDVRINAGFFLLRREIFDYCKDGEELVSEPFARLAAKRLLGAERHEGFWHSMDTFKDKIELDRMEAQNNCPWMVWRRPG